MRSQPTTMTIKQEGNYFRVTLENANEMTEFRLPYWRAESWGRELMNRGITRREAMQADRVRPKPSPAPETTAPDERYL